MMVQNNRAANGQDDWMYTADGKKYFIVGEPLKAKPEQPKPLTMEQRIVVQLSTIREKFRSLHFRKVRDAIKAREASK